MSSTVNKLILRGRLGKDPDTRYLPSGDPVTYFPLATQEGEHTEWHSIYAYREWSQVAATFRSGDLVWFEGRIKSRSFHSSGYDKPRTVRECVASFLALVARKSGPMESAHADAGPPVNGDPDEQHDFASERDVGFNVPSWL